MGLVGQGLLQGKGIRDGMGRKSQKMMTGDIPDLDGPNSRREGKEGKRVDN